MNKTSLEKTILVVGASLLLAGCFAALAHAASPVTTLLVTANATSSPQTFALSTSTANVTAGTNDQTFLDASTTANVAQTKAARTLFITTMPTNGQTITVGSCVVTFSTGADSLNCSGNAATLSITTHNATSTLTAALTTLTNVSSAGHGALSATSTPIAVTFTTAGTETSATAITFTDGTGGSISSTASTVGVIPVAQVDTLNIGGTAEVGDKYIFTDSLGTINYTTVASDTTAINIGIDVNAAIQASSTYSSLLFTSVASTTAGAVVLTAKTPGVSFFDNVTATNRLATTEVMVATVSSIPQVGAIYKLTLPTGLLSYTTVASDTSQAAIAVDVASAVIASSTYSGQVFTATSSLSAVNITFSAKTPGTGFNLAATTTNASPTAEVVSFTLPSFTTDSTYGITINSNTYSYTGANTSTVVTGLAAAMTADPAATCLASGSTITCTAIVPGTAFTYSTSAADVVVSVAVGGGTEGGGGGGGGGSFNVVPTITTTPVTPTTTVTTPLVTPPMTGGASKIKSSLRYLSRNSSVKELQTLFSADPNLHYTSGVTGYFGLKTEAAVELFQTTYGVANYLDPGYGMVGPKTRAALTKIYGM